MNNGQGRSVDSHGGAGTRPLDLTGRERQLRSAMSVLSRVAAKFCRAARRTLPFMVRRKSRLLPSGVSIAEAPGEARRFSGPVFTVTLEGDEGPSWAQLLLNAPALALVLEGTLGGAGDGSASALGNELTLAQRALATRLCRSLATDLAVAIREEAGLGVQIVAMQSLPASERVTFPGADGLLVDCQFENTRGDPTISIVMSAEALQAAAKEQNTEEAAHGDPRMAEALQQVEVEIVAELGRVTMGLRELMGLSVGQVLRLATAVDDPVTVRIAGTPKLVGVPVVSRGQLAIDVRGRTGPNHTA